MSRQDKRRSPTRVTAPPRDETRRHSRNGWFLRDRFDHPLPSTPPDREGSSSVPRDPQSSLPYRPFAGRRRHVPTKPSRSDLDPPLCSQRVYDVRVLGRGRTPAPRRLSCRLDHSYLPSGHRLPPPGRSDPHPPRRYHLSLRSFFRPSVSPFQYTGFPGIRQSTDPKNRHEGR